MTQPSYPTLRAEVNETVIWLLAVLTFSAWVPLSFLPVAGVIEAWGSPLAVLVELAFFGAGAFGLLTAYAVYRWSSRGDAARASAGDRPRSRVKPLTGYALLWLVAYGLYKFF